MEARLITLANEYAKRNHMDFPDYDESNLVYTLADSITILMSGSVGDKIEFSELYDFLSGKYETVNY